MTGSLCNVRISASARAQDAQKETLRHTHTSWANVRYAYTHTYKCIYASFNYVDVCTLHCRLLLLLLLLSASYYINTDTLTHTLAASSDSNNNNDDDENDET